CRDLARDTRGAAYVEFLIAFLPMFLLFLCIWQFGRITTTRVLCDHAAAAAARAGAVIIAEPEADGKVLHRANEVERSQISTAAFVALAPVIAMDWLSSVTVTLPKAPGAAVEENDFTPNAGQFEVPPTKMVHVRVAAQFRCSLPPADYLMCRHSADAGWTFPIVAEASFPYQGARYDYKPSDGG
ncbi:MAG TPA: TadE/TadG family type IV pilus assembly protein, partial [Polyangiaceae bacterium]